MIRVIGIVTAALAFGMALELGASEQRVYSRTESEAGKTLVTIGNRFSELTFEPARGGRCVRFRLHDTGEQLIGTTAVSGMFIDHWAKYPWPSALMWLPYQHRLVGDGETRVGIELWVEVPPTGGGKGASTPEPSGEMPTSPELVGLVVRKTVWLDADRDVIEVEHAVENPTKSSRAVAAYVQHTLSMGGSSYHDNWYLPSGRGVVVNIQPGVKGGRAIGPDWVLDPTAGWIGVIDRETHQGMLFAFDYNYVERIYTSGATAEWFMQAGPVGPGSSFKTRYVVKPLMAFEDLVHGGEHLVADIRPDEVDGKVRVYHDIAAVSRVLRDVHVQFRVTGWRSKHVISERNLTLERLGSDIVRQEFEFEPEKLADGVVIRATVRAGRMVRSYEYFYAGDTAEREARYDPFATQGQALAGVRGEAYFQTQPKRTKRIDKPDFATLAGPKTGEFRCLVVFGLYTHVLNIDDAMADWKQEVAFEWANCPPNAVETFPGTYDELFAFNTVVLSDVNYKALGDIAFEMVCDYVRQGGNLLVVGGPYAFGNGEFAETRFEELLPVELSGPFDLKWAGEGKSWPLRPAQPSHAALRGISFAEDPRVFWHHFVAPKKDTHVVLEAGGEPALILGRYGKGKVAALTLSPTGFGAGDETQWWDWNGWFPLLRNVFTWLNE